jgi:type IV pilus assembly protein PilE
MVKKIKQKGFTLIELLIVIAIISILVAVAYPAYSHHVIKARRVEAQVALWDLATRMEQYYSENNHSYKNANLTELKVNETTANNFYTLAITGITPTAYVLVAKPLGVQAEHDTTCATLTLNQLGQKSATGTTPTECW